MDVSLGNVGVILATIGGVTLALAISMMRSGMIEVLGNPSFDRPVDYRGLVAARTDARIGLPLIVVGGILQLDFIAKACPTGVRASVAIAAIALIGTIVWIARSNYVDRETCRLERLRQGTPSMKAELESTAGSLKQEIEATGDRVKKEAAKHATAMAVVFSR